MTNEETNGLKSELTIGNDREELWIDSRQVVPMWETGID